KRDERISFKPALPAVFKDPLLGCVIPPCAPRVQPAFDAERLSRQIQHTQTREAVRAGCEICVVEDPRVGAKDPLVGGLIERLRWLLPLAYQISQVVLR